MEIASHTRVQDGIRLIAHALLAIFVANAANKFFVVDLDHEEATRFYARIFMGQGDAPDQYRILPLLPLKLLCEGLSLPFHYAVLLYNMVFGFAVLELHWRLGKTLAPGTRWAMSFGLAMLYIYLQYTGWRPDTMGLLLLCALAALVIREVRDPSLRWGLWGLGILLLSWSRADIALIYALFGTFYRSYNYAWFIPVPIASQILLQGYVFPQAAYYSKTVMLLDNLSGYYLVRNPATYLILAAMVAFWKPLRAFVADTFQKNRYFYLLMLGYLILVLVIGRLNEYRLYLPFLPLWLVIFHGRKLKQGSNEASPV
jgi:hypothetical protein